MYLIYQRLLEVPKQNINLAYAQTIIFLSLVNVYLDIPGAVNEMVANWARGVTRHIFIISSSAHILVQLKNKPK